MSAKITLTLACIFLVVLPCSAQLTFKVGANVLGRYASHGTVLGPRPGLGGPIELDRSDATTLGVLMGAELVDGDFWQLGLGIDHLFPRSIDGHTGHFSFTGAYAISRLQLQRTTAPFVSARLGWTIFRGDSDYKDPTYSGVPIQDFRGNARIDLKGRFTYGASIGVARGPFRFEIAYLNYQGNRRVRQTTHVATSDIRTLHTFLSIQIGYAIRLLP